MTSLVYKPLYLFSDVKNTAQKVTGVKTVIRHASAKTITTFVIQPWDVSVGLVILVSEDIYIMLYLYSNFCQTVRVQILVCSGIVSVFMTSILTF